MKSLDYLMVFKGNLQIARALNNEELTIDNTLLSTTGKHYRQNTVLYTAICNYFLLSTFLLLMLQLRTTVS